MVAIAIAGTLQLVTQGVASAAPDAWTGTVAVARADVYDSPGGNVTGSLESGTLVTVSNWVYGPQVTADNYTWADVGGGRYIHSSMLRHSPLPAAPPLPPQIISSNHWADANLTLQILTLYEGDTPVRMSLMNSGRPGPETESHPGTWSILRRVADETMRGDGYDIAGVLFTQYFTADAEAIHLNYWLADDERGIPRSHGCLGLDYADAAFAWRFLDIGSPVYVHA
jgi:L,D-transpeptidase-like protein